MVIPGKAIKILRIISLHQVVKYCAQYSTDLSQHNARTCHTSILVNF